MMKRHNNSVRCTALIAICIMLAGLLPISGPWAQRSYAEGESVVIKQGAVVIPIDFGNNNLTGGGVAFTGSSFGPQVQIAEMSEENELCRWRYMLDDLYNRTGLYEQNLWFNVGETSTGVKYKQVYPFISVNAFLKNASYGKNVVSPIFLSNSAEEPGPNRQFVPFSVGTQEELEEINKKSQGDSLSAELMEPYLQKALKNASEIKALKQKSVEHLLRVKNYYLGVYGEVKQEIDHVVFLVNMSSGGEPNPRNYRAYAVNNTGRLLGTLTMDTGTGALEVYSYTVIPVDENITEKIIHETMHIKGVEDLYLEADDGEQPAIPCGSWDVQGNHETCSGPYYTQRRDMLIGNYDQATQAAVQIKAEAIRMPGEKDWVPFKTRLRLNDINCLKKEAIVQHIEVATEKGRLTDFYIEYRHPKTDLVAKWNQNKSEDGFLLVYATDDFGWSQQFPYSPAHQYVRLLEEVCVSKLLNNSVHSMQLFIDKDGVAYLVDPKAEAANNNDTKKPMLIIPREGNPESERVKYKFKDGETGILADIDFSNGSKEDDGSLSCDMNIKLRSVTAADFEK